MGIKATFLYCCPDWPSCNSYELDKLDNLGSDKEILLY